MPYCCRGPDFLQRKTDRHRNAVAQFPVLPRWIGGLLQGSGQVGATLTYGVVPALGIVKVCLVCFGKERG